MLLTGNTTAHAEALKAEILARSPGSNSLHLLHPAAWYQISCADGFENLMDSVSQALRGRTGLWTVILVTEAEHASPPQIVNLVGRFWLFAWCTHATALWQLTVDCRRTLFALSTAFGSDLLEAEPHCLAHSCANEQSEISEGGISKVGDMACADGNEEAGGAGASPVAACLSSSFSSLLLRQRMLWECSAWLAALQAAAPTSQRPARAMRKSMVVALGSPRGHLPFPRS